MRACFSERFYWEYKWGVQDIIKWLLLQKFPGWMKWHVCTLTNPHFTPQLYFFYLILHIMSTIQYRVTIKLKKSWKEACVQTTTYMRARSFPELRELYTKPLNQVGKGKVSFFQQEVNLLNRKLAWLSHSCWAKQGSYIYFTAIITGCYKDENNVLTWARYTHNFSRTTFSKVLPTL